MSDEILLNEAAYAVWQTVMEKGPSSWASRSKVHRHRSVTGFGRGDGGGTEGFFKVDVRKTSNCCEDGARLKI